MTEASRYLQKASREGAANLVASATVTRCPTFGILCLGKEISRFIPRLKPREFPRDLIPSASYTIAVRLILRIDRSRRRQRCTKRANDEVDECLAFER